MRHGHLEDSGKVPHHQLDYAVEAANFLMVPNGNTIWTTGSYYAADDSTSYTRVLQIRGMKCPGIDYVYLAVRLKSFTTDGDVKIIAGSDNQEYAVSTSQTDKVLRIDVSSVSDFDSFGITLNVKNDTGGNNTGVDVKYCIASPRSDLTTYDDSITY